MPNIFRQSKFKRWSYSLEVIKEHLKKIIKSSNLTYHFIIYLLFWCLIFYKMAIFCFFSLINLFAKINSIIVHIVCRKENLLNEEKSAIISYFILLFCVDPVDLPYEEDVYVSLESLPTKPPKEQINKNNIFFYIIFVGLSFRSLTITSL